jgi:hypothetical protein
MRLVEILRHPIAVKAALRTKTSPCSWKAFSSIKRRIFLANLAVLCSSKRGQRTEMPPPSTPGASHGAPIAGEGFNFVAATLTSAPSIFDSPSTQDALNADEASDASRESFIVDAMEEI